MRDAPVLVLATILVPLILLALVPAAAAQMGAGLPGVEPVSNPGNELLRGLTPTLEARNQAELMRERNITLLGTGSVDPETYVLGPGDLLGLEVYGSFSLSIEDMVGSDGSVTFPQLGTFRVGGLTLAEARAEVKDRARRLVRNAEVDLLLVTVRAFKVYVVGWVKQPGAVMATPLTRVSEVLAGAGGVRDSTSLRRIEIVHTDGTRDRADLLGFLLKGEIEGNPNLADGDVVVIPPQTDLISIRGGVLFPGVYDFVEGDELGETLRFVQLLPSADRRRALIQRSREDAGWDTLGVDLEQVLAGTIRVPLAAGDHVFIRERGEWRLDASVTVAGAVRYPGPLPIDPGRTRVLDAVEAAGGFLDDAVPARVTITRAYAPDTTRIADPDDPKPYVDQVTRLSHRTTVTDLTDGPGPFVEPGDLLTVPRHTGWVQVMGRVKNPGYYDYHEEWGYQDYLDAAGGFGKHADKSRTKISRENLSEGTYAADVKSVAPGDLIWVPERDPHDFWTTTRDVVIVTTQLLTVYLLAREIGK